MPFNLPFNLPFFYNNYRYRYPQNPIRNSYSNINSSQSSTPNSQTKVAENTIIPEKKASDSVDASEAFFEIFGIKLYLDDILIICILFFLYTEKVQDEELFVCLILLLLT